MVEACDECHGQGDQKAIVHGVFQNTYKRSVLSGLK